jgi:transcriptional regulator with XRE-family HTH domain
MIKSPVSVAMGEEIRHCMRQKKVTQQVLADQLSVTRHVLSQMLRGSVLFSVEQMDRLLQCIDPGEETGRRWRETCAALQQGLVNSTQGDNTYWRALRERRGLSLPMLSNRCGIKVSRLTYIESVGADGPDEAEAHLLRRIFGVSDKLPGQGGGRYEREPRTGEGHQYIVPLIYLDDLLLLERKVSLEELVKSRSRENIYWEVSSSEPVYAVLADCKMLQVSFPGFAVLIVSERNNMGFHQMELRFDRKNTFALHERHNGVWMPVKHTLPGTVCVSPMWSLPVLDMMFKPYDLTLGVKNK